MAASWASLSGETMRLASQQAASTSASSSSGISGGAGGRVAAPSPRLGGRRPSRARAPTTTAPRAAARGASQQQPPVGKMRGNIDAWHGADFPRDSAAAGAVPGARTVATPSLSPELAFERLLAAGARAGARNPVAAFFSSELGGIVTNPGLAAVHADDHWLHSGHGASERVPLAGGALYQLAPRLARLCAAARAVGCPVPLAPAALARVVLDTAAASRLMNGTLHVWVSRGRGGLTGDPREVAAAGHGPALYVSASAESSRRDSERASPLDRTRGWRATTSPVPPAPHYFGALLGNARADVAVAQAEARARGFDTALLVDEEGCLLGGALPGSCLALVTDGGELVVVPGGDRAPRCLTLERLAALVPVFSNPDDLPLHGGVRYATGSSGPTDFPRVNEAAWKKQATRAAAAGRRAASASPVGAVREMLLVDALRGVTPIVSWDDVPVGDGTPGEVGLALHQLLKEDRRPPGPGEHPLGERDGVASEGVVGEGDTELRLPLHVHVPYGYLTGMMDELV